MSRAQLPVDTALAGVVGGAAGKGEARAVAALAILVIVAGAVRGIVGLVAWALVRSQLAAEKIRIPESADQMGGRAVRGPLSAFAEAEVIRKIALKATRGRTYGELDENDPSAHLAMEASLLRSSLFTSILAFGVAAAEIVLGGLLVAIGAALLLVTRRLPRTS